ncbi:MAG: hypothetical protein GEV09_15535 [Pseudonocardiaceae bacterium]|nr:hypothetical protein [Pseudonocardiaceae bacterium]
MSRTEWAPIIGRAAEIVASYDTSVTLRQLFYRLVSERLLPNTDTSYKTLSHRTAAARRAGTFPELIDRGRSIHRYRSYDSPADALSMLARTYRRDRTEHQPYSIYLAVEKAGLVVQLQSWFGDLGFPIIALGGYSSQSYVDNVAADVIAADRPAVLLYGGDHDPSGEDIDRDFVARTDCWAKVIRVALSAEQVIAYDLPPMPGKAKDSRAAGFAARHGELRQVELDALPPEALRGLYGDAVDQFWNFDTYQESRDREYADKSTLRHAARVIES